LNVPILINGAAWGVLEVDSTRSRDFTEDSVDFFNRRRCASWRCDSSTRRADYEARFAAAAAEAQKREVLLREMQHRVKNNFQLVLSSISLQKRRHQGAEVQSALDHVASLINAISLAHDQLAPGQEGQTVRLTDYVHALCSAIQQQVEEIELKVESDELEISIDRALRVGLILNEVTMNSIKHAFGPNGGSIKVRLVGGVGFGEARLTVSDNGRGIQKSNGNGSGLRLIRSLARQIGGAITQQSGSSGTTTTLTFPLMN
jgi:two-component system, sensor histidine kinase PdtaS